MKQGHVLLPAVLARERLLQFIRLTEMFVTGHLIPAVNTFFAAIHCNHTITYDILFLGSPLNIFRTKLIGRSVFLFEKRKGIQNTPV